MRSLVVVYRNALFDTPDSLVDRAKCLIEEEVNFQDAIDAFSDSVLVDIAVLCHTQLHPPCVKELGVSMTTVLDPSVRMMNQHINGVDGFLLPFCTL